MNILSAVQTRSGLTLVKEKWLEMIEKNPWADFSHIQEGLWETDTIVFPLFALKYTWNGSGIGKFILFEIIISFRFSIHNEFHVFNPLQQ